MKLASAAFMLSGWAAAGSTSSHSLSFADLSQFLIALTGLVAAVSAFVLGMRERRRVDPRDKLLELLLQERKESDRDDGPDDEKPPPRRRRPRR